MENTIGSVLVVSEYSILHNWLLVSNPIFLYCTHCEAQYRLQYKFLNQYGSHYTFPLVDGQTGFVRFPAKTHGIRVHADVITEDVVKSQVQGTREM